MNICHILAIIRHLQEFIIMMTKSTISAKKETVERDWYVIDATDKVLGRLSTEIADMLRGKKKPAILLMLIPVITSLL